MGLYLVDGPSQKDMFTFCDLWHWEFSVVDFLHSRSVYLLLPWISPVASSLGSAAVVAAKG